MTDETQVVERRLYQPVGAPIVRVPMLPIECYIDLAVRGADGFLRDGSVTSEVRDRVLCALAAASFSTYDALARPPASTSKAATLARTLLRYLIRMSYRATPYGMFAGVALGRWSETTTLALESVGPIHVRPDMGWLYRVVADAEADDEVRRHLRCCANPQIQRRADRILLGDPGAGSPTPPVSIRATGAVQRALDAARRPVPYANLRALLLETSPGATGAQVDRLLAELCRLSFLETDLRPPLTAGPPAEIVARRLSQIPPAAGRAAALDDVLALAAACTASPGPEAFRGLASAGAAMGAAERGEPTFQVDMAWQLRGDCIAQAIGDEAAAAAEALLRLGAWPDGPPHVRGLRELFLARYGPHRDVPLREVIGADLGPAAPDAGPAAAPLADQRRMDLAAEALYDRRREVVLTEETLASLSRWEPDPARAPASLELLVLVLGASAAQVNAGNFRLLVAPNVGAGAMGRHVARFGALLGEPVRAELAAQAAHEQARDSGALFAELVYRPQNGRSANVALRPGVRPHEICIGAAPGVTDEAVLLPDDLLVGFRDGRLVLLHRKTAQVVRVRCTTMLNHVHEPPLVRLLAEIEQDSEPQLIAFDWGTASRLPFLPRCVYRRTILAPAQWRLAGSGKPMAPPAFASWLDRWRARWDVPRHVCAGEADNRLLLDLDDRAQADELRHELNRSADAEVVVEEALPAPDDVWLPGPQGRYVLEVVVPLGRPPQPTTATEAPEAEPGANGTPASDVAEIPRTMRVRPPGTEWLHAKLFLPRWAEVDFLIDHTAPFVTAMLERGLARGWFFIRYASPDPHIRLRFRGPAHLLREELLPALCRWAAPLVETGVCDRYDIDVYEREIERYGGVVGMEAAEDLFVADSTAVLGLLALQRSGHVKLDPIALGMLTTDDLLGGLGLLPDRRLAVYEEGDDDPDASREVYRARKGELRGLLADPIVLRRLCGGRGGAILDARREALASVAWQIADARARGTLSCDPGALYGSYVHMHSNRLFGIDWAAEKLVIGLLRRVRDSYRHAAPDVSDIDVDAL